MHSIDHVILEVPDVPAAEEFYGEALGLRGAVELRESQAATSGFRGFTIGLDVNSPAGVDSLLDASRRAGATSLKPPKKQFWGGYSGVIQTPDGTVLKIATTSRKQTGSASREVERVVLLLGVADVAASKGFYVDRGLVVAKAYGSRYVEYEPATGSVTLGLYRRDRLAKEFGVSPEGSGSHRMAIASDAGTLTDLDGFAWVAGRAES